VAFVVLIVLLAVASVDRWVRGKGWTEPGPPVPGLTLAGVGLGLVALGAALLFAGPALERATERSIDWTQITAVRGNLGILVTAVAVLGAQAIASELVFRRWMLDRLHGLGAQPWLAAVAAAVAEGVVSGGHLGSRLGAAAAGLGFGLLYLGAGRRLAPAIACRLAFEIGALLIVYARLV
jgi:membrane protease YdiL (CAAX protease family)